MLFFMTPLISQWMQFSSLKPSHLASLKNLFTLLSSIWAKRDRTWVWHSLPFIFFGNCGGGALSVLSGQFQERCPGFLQPKHSPFFINSALSSGQNYIYIHRIWIFWTRVKVELPQALFLGLPVVGRWMGSLGFGDCSFLSEEVVLEPNHPFIPLVKSGGRVLECQDVLLERNRKGLLEVLYYHFILG